MKVIIILGGYLLMVLIGLLSCIKCGPFPTKYKVESLEWQSCKSFYPDSLKKGLIHLPMVNDTVVYFEYSVWITPKIKTYYAGHQKSKTSVIINYANACEPVEPGTDEKIDSIKIFCDQDFNMNYPAGTDLSGLFDIEVLDKANYIYYERFKLSEYTRTKPSFPIDMTIILTESPENTTEFEFLMKFYQNSKGVGYFEFKTNKVVIKK